MTQKFKVGDVVRFGVGFESVPIYDYGGGTRKDFVKYQTAKVTAVADHGVFWTQHERLAQSDLKWRWPASMPAHHDAKYWPTLETGAVLGPQSVDEIKTPTCPTSPAKETHMSKHILALAATKHSSPGVAETTPLSGRLQEALRVALEKQAQENAEAAAAEILSVMRSLENEKERQRSQIRTLRAQIDTAVKRMNDLDRAMEYAGETENFVPLMSVLGLYIDGSFFAQNPDVPRIVPADWVKAGLAAPTKKSKKS